MKHNASSRSLSVLAFLILFLCFVPSAYSHPGNTDVNGGHYVKDTGEYHYHHGYPAHQHSDLDGDGKLDCPYDFKDNTSDSSSNSSGSSTSSGITPEIMEKARKLRKNNEDGADALIFTFVFFSIIFAICAIDEHRYDIVDWLKSLFR